MHSARSAPSRARTRSARCPPDALLSSCSPGADSTTSRKLRYCFRSAYPWLRLMMPKSPQSHLDPRKPLVVDTAKLPRQPGATRALKRVVPAPAALGLELISVPKGSDLELDLSLTSVSEGVYVSGTVRGSLSGECGRC